MSDPNSGGFLLGKTTTIRLLNGRDLYGRIDELLEMFGLLDRKKTRSAA